MLVVRDGPRLLDAHFSIVPRDERGVHEITIESRGGGRNSDYIQAFDLLLGRLQALGADLLAVGLSSTIALQKPKDERELSLADFPLPLSLSTVSDISQLRADIGKAAAKKMRRADAKGPGNTTKRVSLFVTLPPDVGPLEDNLSGILSDGASYRRTTSSGPPPISSASGWQRQLTKASVYLMRLEGVARSIFKIGFSGAVEVRLKQLNREIRPGATGLRWALVDQRDFDDPLMAFACEQALILKLASHVVEGEREIFDLPHDSALEAFHREADAALQDRAD